MLRSIRGCPGWSAWLVLSLTATGLIGCGAGEEPSGGTEAPASEQRLVSLSPALTQMVVDLGAGDRLVGVGRFDPAAPEGLPVVGDLYEIDYEKLLSVAPTDLLMQPPADGVPEKLRDLAGQRGWRIHGYTIETIADVQRALAGAEGRGIGEVVGKPARALALRRTIDAQLEQLLVLLAEQRSPRTLLLVGLNPITAAGPETFLSEMLTMASGQNVVEATGSRYPAYSKEKVLGLKPEVIVIFQPGGRGVAGEAPMPEVLADLDVPAVTHGRVHWIDDPMALIPSTTMPRVAGELAKRLHPDRAAAIERVLNGPASGDAASASPERVAPTREPEAHVAG
jgi:ABC-type hemin transport system substrate-binding protein